MEKIAKQYRKRRRLHARLRFASAVIRHSNRFAFYVLIIVICIAAHAISLPEYEILKEKELVYQESLSAEAVAQRDFDKALREHRAIQEEPDYLELLARDSLNYYRPGEIIFDVTRETPEPVIVK